MGHMTPPVYWTIPQDQCRQLTPVQARDLILECFFFAQKEAFAHSKEKLGLPASDEDVRKSVRLVMEKGFLEINGSFERPTRETLVLLVELLVRKSLTWGMPHEVVEHHHAQIAAMLTHLL